MRLLHICCIIGKYVIDPLLQGNQLKPSTKSYKTHVNPNVVLDSKPIMCMPTSLANIASMETMLLLH